MNRRLILAALLASGGFALAEDNGPRLKPVQAPEPEEIQRSIDRGIAFLLQNQNKDARLNLGRKRRSDKALPKIPPFVRVRANECRPSPLLLGTNTHSTSRLGAAVANLRECGTNSLIGSPGTSRDQCR